MYLLYADESGSVGDMGQQHFILAGVCLYERQSFWLANEMDKIAARFNPADPNAVELHGSPMYGGRKFWRAFSREARHEAIADCLKLFAASNISNRVFAIIIKKALFHLWTQLNMHLNSYQAVSIFS